MSEPLVLTIDFGTQSVRVSIFDNKGTILAMEKETYDPAYYSAKPGYAEQDPDYYYDCLCHCTKRIVKKNPELIERVAGITETCFRDSAVLLDKSGNVIRPMILWLDQRFAQCNKKLPLTARLAFNLVGMAKVIDMNRKRTVSNWLIENEPENWNRVDKYLAVSTYFVYRLTGQMKDSAANLTGHYPIDFKKKKWYPKPDKHLKGQIFSIKESMLCEIVPEGDKIGNILPKAAKETGLPEGLPVFAAGSDKSCETLGTGVVDSDYLAVSLGTACTVETTVTKYIEPIKFLPCYPACVDGYYNMDVQIYRGFWMINWFLKEFGATVIDDVTLSEYVADDFNKEMMTIPAGSGGLVLQPFWGPLLDRPAVKGAVVGFNDSTRRIHFYKAIIEGIGYALREAAEGFEKKLHKGFRGVRISGGGSLSPEICQVMADIFGLPVTRVQTNEASSLGAAMAAFIALGTYHDPKDAAKNMVTIRDTFQPNFVNHQVYNKLYKDVYLKLYPSLKSSYQYLWNFAK